MKYFKYYSELYYNWGSVAYLQQDFGDYGVDVKHSVQIKTQELLTAPDRETQVLLVVVVTEVHQNVFRFYSEGY